ncbi:MAG: repressor LexA [Candidatus Coatesbacteria bacterium]|nr:MAG: repressor LexA [Candidatus Coatesbacteria bacterium]
MEQLTRRQAQVLEFITTYLQQHGCAPSLREIARRLGVSSIGSLHKHLVRLERKGFIRRVWNKSRAIEVVQERNPFSVSRVPLVGTVAAGLPVEALEDVEEVDLAEMLTAERDCFALRVRGDSMVDDQIADGDCIVVERRPEARNGELVIALLDGSECTLKRFYREGDMVRLQPANETFEPIVVPAERVSILGVVRGVVRRY